jgi:hypothetical protein
MTPAEIQSWTKRSRAAQGLSPAIEAEPALRRIVALLLTQPINPAPRIRRATK